MKHKKKINFTMIHVVPASLCINIHYELHYYAGGVFNLFIQGLRLKCQCAIRDGNFGLGPSMIPL